MTSHTLLQTALLKNALKRHANDVGKYVFVNVDDGNSFVGNDASDAFAKEAYWYGHYTGYHVALTRCCGCFMVGVIIPEDYRPLS